MRTIAPKSLCGAVLLISVVAIEASAHECAVYNVYEPEGLQKGQDISLGLFDFDGLSPTAALKTDTLRLFVAERFQKELEKSRQFRTVRSLTSQSDSQRGDYHVEGAITQIDPGTRWMRALAASGAAKVRLRGAIRLASGRMLLDFECEGAEMGGAFGAGGWFAAFDSAESLVRKSFDKFAVDFAKTLKEVDGQWISHLKKGPRKRATSEGQTASSVKAWRQQLAGSWTPEDHSTEVAAHVVETQNRNWFRVHALWLTRAAYESNHHLNTFEFKRSDYKLADGLLPDLSALDRLRPEPVYLIGVTFETATTDGSTDGDEPPFFWSDDAIRNSASLVRAGAPGAKAVAAEAVRLRPYLQRRGTFGVRWRNVPVVFAFNTHATDGSPLIESLDDVIELRTSLPGHETLIRFRLADFGLADVGQLRPAR